MKKISMILTVSALMFLSGCTTIGQLIAIATTSTPSEQKIPAEYKLTPKAGRVVVLVSQPAWVRSQINLRSYLTKALNAELAVRLGFKAGQLVGYDQVVELRSGRSDFGNLTSAEIGKLLQAEKVLFIVVADYGLYELDDTGYYKGLLDLKASLIDSATGQKLWPESSEAKSVKVGFEAGPKGLDFAGRRLSASAAFCVVRYLHDMTAGKFKIFDERAQADWQSESYETF